MLKTLRYYLEVATNNRHDTSTVLFAIAGFVGLLQANLRHVSWGQGFEMLSIAQNLTDHAAFANPFWILDTGPTAANPPMYPLLLAVLFKMLNRPEFVVLAATIGSILMNALAAALLPYVSFLFFGEVLPGLVASILWMGAMQPLPSWDTSYTVVGLLVFCMMTASAINQGKRVFRKGIIAGILAGVVFLLNPSTILIFLPWLIYLCWRHLKANARPALVYGFILLVAFSIFPMFWAIRNYQQLGAFVTRTNLGMTLYSSNNDCAQSTLIKNEANNCYQEHHPNVSVDEAQLLRQLGEVQYDRKRIADTKNWIHSHRSRFVQLTLQRFQEFWFPPVEFGSYYHAVFICLITLLSIPGLFWMMGRREPVTPFVLGVLLLYPLIYYIVVTDVRYRYPILWLSLLPAGYLASRLLDSANNKAPSPPSGP